MRNFTGPFLKRQAYNARFSRGRVYGAQIFLLRPCMGRLYSTWQPEVRTCKVQFSGIRNSTRLICVQSSRKESDGNWNLAIPLDIA